MGDLEEALKRRYHLVDSRSVRHQNTVMIIVSLLIFTTYAAFLWLLCSLSSSALAALLLVATQISLGFPVTRAYYDFGLATSSRLRFYDPSYQDLEGDMHDFRIKTADIPLVFEMMVLQVKKYDKGKLDDLMDISWFLVIVWAILSAGAHYFNLLGQILCVLGVFVLLAACLAGYMSGYWTKRGSSFEESLDHLEYYVVSLLKNLDAVLPAADSALILRLKSRGRKAVILDIVAEYIIGNVMLEYHVGLSSALRERFILKSSGEAIGTAYERLISLRPLLESGWIVERAADASDTIIRILNPVAGLKMADSGTYIKSPSVVERNSRVPQSVLSSIVSVIDSSYKVES